MFKGFGLISPRLGVLYCFRIKGILILSTIHVLDKVFLTRRCVDSTRIRGRKEDSSDGMGRLLAETLEFFEECLRQLAAVDNQAILVVSCVRALREIVRADDDDLTVNDNNLVVHGISV